MHTFSRATCLNLLTRILTAASLLIPAIHLHAQSLQVLSLGNPSSLRGLSVVNDRVIWVSGSGGTVGLSVNGGASWNWMTVSHYEHTDFRDVEGFSEREAVIMGISEPAVILKTRDGGKTWATVFQDSSKAIFLDAISFSGDRGLLLGDPVNGKIFLAETRDRGDSWTKFLDKDEPSALAGEAFFAASGSNIQWLPGNRFCFVSGGKSSALYISGSVRHPLKLNQGKETTGANAVAINPADPEQLYITGGDFARDGLDSGNALSVRLHPFRQQKPRRAPHGYRSSVEYLDRYRLICCGTTGVDWSSDGGMTWRKIASESFHVCRKSKSGNRIFLAGAQGRIAVLACPANSPAY